MCFAIAALAAAQGGLSAASTMSIIGAVASDASSVFSAYSSFSGASANKQAANYNAAIQRNNALAAQYQAEDAVNRGNLAVDEHMRKVAALKGTQTATMAARGLDLSEGTPLNILTDTDILGEADANTIRTNASREAWGYKQQANNATAQGNLYKMQAKNINPMMAAGGTLLGGAGSVADRWYSSSGGGDSYRLRLQTAASRYGWD
jgi:hypothetical protein